MGRFRLFYRDLSAFDGRDVAGTMGKVVKLVDNFDSLYEYVTNEGRTFWFRTNMDAPKNKVTGEADHAAVMRDTARDLCRGFWGVERFS